jgi:hypothetical protein
LVPALIRGAIRADDHSVIPGAESSPAFPDWMVLAVPVLCAAAVVYLAYAIHRYGGRERALRRVAATEGLVFTTADPAGIGSLRFPTFARAKGVRVTNVLWAREGAGEPRARVFDFSLFEERESHSDGRDALDGLADEVFGFDRRAAEGVTRTYSASRTGAVVRVDAFLPPCIVMPTTWMTRAFETVGIADIDFESDEFNRGWDVRCGDRRFASLFLDAQMIDLIVSLEPKVGLETFGNYILFTTKFARPPAMATLLRAARSVPSILSPLVVDEYPTVAAMEARSSLDSWSARPDGRGGMY